MERTTIKNNEVPFFIHVRETSPTRRDSPARGTKTTFYKLGRYYGMPDTELESWWNEIITYAECENPPRVGDAKSTTVSSEVSQ